MRATLTSPPRSRRRAVFAGRRTRKAAMVGFHGRRSEALVDVPECLVVRPEILAARPALGAADRGSAASRVGGAPADRDARAGRARRRRGRRARRSTPGCGSGWRRLAEAADLARLAWDGEVGRRCAGRPSRRWARARVVPPPGAFLQATAEGERALVDAVREACGGAAAGRRPLRRLRHLRAAARRGGGGARGGGGGGDAGGARRGGARRAGCGGSPRRRAISSAGRCCAAELDRLRRGGDRPAARRGRGAEPRARRARRCRGSPRSPATRRPSRATRLLVDGGYRLDWVQPVDQFRWSGHVELAAALQPVTRLEATRAPATSTRRRD